MTDEAAVNTYDSIPYDSYPFEYTRPAHLATVAGLFGCHSADPAGCRVLELGCGAGANLLPLAVVYPGSRFVGIDSAASAIAQAQAEAAALGLDNIRFECRDILTIDRELGTFDYIICHGVYSWVPEPVQAKILELCRSLLTEYGVAYVSYNTYPGWHLRATVREMMNYHTRGFSDDRERIAQSRALLNFLVESVPQGNAYGQMLREELELVRDRADGYLFHEHLEICNQPLYFHEFAERAVNAGLCYLGESGIASMMLASDVSPEVRQTFARIAPDIVRFEQYLDFLRNRTFRRTLLCHREVQLTRKITPDTIAGYRVSCAIGFRPQDNAAPGGGLVFTHPGGASVTAHAPVERAVLATLVDRSPQSVPLTELAEIARTRFAVDDPPEVLMQKIGIVVLECAANGLLDLHRHPDLFVFTAGERPATTKLALHQLGRGNFCTTLRHSRVELPPFDRYLLELLDGTRDRAALAHAMTGRVQSGDLKLTIQGEAVTDPAIIADVMGPSVDKGLERLARAMLLVA